MSDYCKTTGKYRFRTKNDAQRALKNISKQKRGKGGLSMKYYNEIVPHDLAVELKASGFDEVTRKCYGYDNNLVSAGGLNNSQQEYEYQLCHFVGATLLISAPTFADVFDWLFSKGIYIQTTPVNAIWDLWRKNIYYKHSEHAYKSLNPNANLSIESFIKDSCDSIRKALDIIKQEKEERK